MRKMILGLTLVVGLFVGGTMSASAAADPATVVANAPGHTVMTDGSNPTAQADGLCTAWYAINGQHVRPR